MGDWGGYGFSGRFCDRNMKTGWITLDVLECYRFKIRRVSPVVCWRRGDRGKVQDLEDELLTD